MPVTIAAAGLSDRGLVRENNEDAFYIDPQGKLFLVADGLGGHAGGEKASATVVEAVGAAGTNGWDDPVGELERLLGKADAAVREKAVGELANMGSTVVAIYMQDERYWTAHAGDSRAYRLRGGYLERLTKDHTPEQEGGVGLPAPFRSGMITRAIGIGEETVFDFTSGNTRTGDRFLLCSDGMSGYVGTEEIGHYLTELSPQEACRRLVELSCERGGEDNITVVVVRVEEVS